MSVLNSIRFFDALHFSLDSTLLYKDLNPECSRSNKANMFADFSSSPGCMSIVRILGFYPILIILEKHFKSLICNHIVLRRVRRLLQTRMIQYVVFPAKIKIPFSITFISTFVNMINHCPEIGLFLLIRLYISFQWNFFHRSCGILLLLLLRV